MIIRKAVKQKAKLRLALCGVSGSGKTMGAIKIAKGMGKKFVVIDTEDTSADLYADICDYDVLNLQAPFTPEKYIDAIKLCEKAGYEIIIIDSLSQAWAGTGGILDMHDKATQASNSKNSYTSWREVTPLHNKLIDTILHSPSHIIVTMRSKVHYEMVNINGRLSPQKVGLAPIQKEGLDYEFTIVLDIDQKSHLYTASKDRTRLFDGNHGVLDESVGEALLNFLNSGKSAEEVEQEYKASIANEIEKQATLEALNVTFRTLLTQHPTLKDDIIALKDKRKFELSEVNHETV